MQDNRTNMAVFLRPDKIMNTVASPVKRDIVASWAYCIFVDAHE